MIEDTSVLCPVCNKELLVKVLSSGKKRTYIALGDCSSCGASSFKIERGLNSTGKRWGIKTEKSYLKTDPRG